MLQFFRSIRRRLLESGKVKSYVLYAIGEILLVVIGILLALQVNNWNEARKARAIEHEYLLSLREEFKANLKELDNLISLNRQLMEGAKEFLKYTGLNANSLSIEKMGNYKEIQ
ncbi:MAG: hypothetical protein IPJ74_14270 [Saprospiraceae bacterium]|nr:hypothetical protein [Saprospiraceae bacterium]